MSRENSVDSWEKDTALDRLCVYSFPSTYKDERIALEGTAASVRFYKSGKIAVANCEGACNIKVGGKTIVGGGAFVVEIVGKEAQAVYCAEEGAVRIR